MTARSFQVHLVSSGLCGVTFHSAAVLCGFLFSTFRQHTHAVLKIHGDTTAAVRKNVPSQRLCNYIDALHITAQMHTGPLVFVADLTRGALFDSCI